MLESLFNKVAVFHACNFIKKRLQRRCFTVNIAKVSRTSISKNICERLLLNSEVLSKTADSPFALQGQKYPCMILCIFSFFKLGFNVLKATGCIPWFYIQRKINLKHIKTKITWMLNIHDLTLVQPFTR